MDIVVFEDEQVSRLQPITIGRPAYAVTCGSFRLIDWLARLSRESGASLRGVVRPHLATIQELDYPQFDSATAKTKQPVLVVNARVVPSVSAYRSLARLLQEHQSAAIYENGSVAAAMISPGSATD